MHHRELCAGASGLFGIGLLIACLAAPLPAFAQDAPEAGSQLAEAGTEADSDAPVRIRFNFKDATFEQVIDFFSRETGLPVIWEADPPAGTLDYLSPDSYRRDEALRVLNIILQSRGVMLRISDDMLYLRKLEDMQRADLPTFIGQVPDDVTQEQIITVVRPLSNALAKPLAERMAQMVAKYGSVTAMEQQNALVITETAAQVRRLLRIVEELDREDPEGVIEIFKIKHARAADLMEPLTALMSQRVERFIIDQRGEQQRIEEDEMHGLNISHDARTNSIIARGTQSRIENLRESIALLDVPAASGARSIRTVTLAAISPQEAANRLNEVYAKLPEEERPAVLPLNEFGQVTIVGDEQVIAEGVAVLREIDGGTGGDGEAGYVDRRTAVHVLEHADPDALIAALRGLLNDRQLHSTKVVAGPDGQSLIISGPVTDVAAIENIIPAIDRPARVDRHVRVLRLQVDNPHQVLDRAKAIYNEQVMRDGADDDVPRFAVSTVLDEESRSLTMIGSNDALDRFNAVLQGLQATAVQRETRQVRTQHARPDELAETLRELTARMNAARGFATETDPVIDAFDDLDLLLITATSEQHQAIAPLIQSLDVPKDRTMPPLRILQLRLTDAQNLSNILNRQYQQRPAEERSAKPVHVSADPATNSLIAAAHPDILPEIQAIVEELNEEQRDIDGREIRIFPLKVARARDLARTIDEMFPEPPMPRDARGRPMPHLQQPREIVVRGDEQTNSLIVDAPIARMAGFEQLVEQLDRQQIMEETEIRNYRIAHADLDAVSRTLRELASAGTLSRAGRDRRVPITVTTEPMSRTLIVAGPSDIFERVEGVLHELDARDAGMIGGVRFVQLEHARAEQIAPLVRDIVAATGSATGAGGAASMHIAAEPRLNAVVIAAPPAVMEIAEELARQFDSDPAEQIAPSRTVRVLAVRNADAAELAANLQQIFDEPDQHELPPTIRVDAASNTLLIRASEDQFKSIEQIVQKVDEHTLATSRQMQVIRVDPSRATAAEVAQALQRMLQQSEPTRVRVITVEELRQQREQRAEPADDSRSMLGGQSPTRVEPQMHADEHRSGAVAPGIQNRVPQQSSASISVHLRFHFLSSLVALIAPANTVVVENDDEKVAEADITIAYDEATNSIVILGSPRNVERLTRLAQQVQDQLPAPPGTIRYVPLPDGSNANHLASLMNRTLAQMTPAGGEQGDYRRRVSIISDQPGNALIIAANDHDFETVGDLIAALSQSAAEEEEYDIRSIVLERASAAAVANAVQRLYDDRARIAAQSRGRRGPAASRIAIVGDEASRTVLIAASDEDFEQIKQLAQQFDSPQATDALEFRVFDLKHARATEIRQTVQGLISDLTWNQPGMWFFAPQQRQQQRDRGAIAVRADARLNALIVTGSGDHFAMVEPIIEMLDQPKAEHAAQTVQLYPVRHAQLSLVAEIVREAYVPQRPWWQPSEPSDVRVRADDRNNVLIVSANETEHEQISTLIEQIDSEMTTAQHEMKVLALEFAQAAEVAGTLRQFLRDRARATNEPEPSATIIPSRSANSLVVSAEQADLHTIEDLLARLDQPDATGDRAVEIIALQDGEAQTIARIMSQHFPRRTPGGGQGVIITPDMRTNSLIINAPQRQLAEAKALIDQLDTPPATDETIIRTYSLSGARAEEARRLLAETLQLDDRGRTAPGGISIRLEDAPAGDLPAVAVNARIVADRRSNSLIVTATEQSFPIIEHLIQRIDDVPSVSPVEYRLIRLEHAMADDVSFTLRQMVRATERGETGPRIDYNRAENQLVIAATSDQFEQIERVLREIDVPSERPRKTRFVPLEFAEAEQVREALSVFYGPFAFDADTPGKRNVQLVADPATNSLVISAAEEEWEGIQALLDELDSEEYDASLQLRVLPLVHADAASVARAINDAFAGAIERGPRRDQRRQQRRDDDRRDEVIPTVLVESQEWVRASAEPLTNSVIVSASRQNIRKIEQIVEQLDVADFAKLPSPRIIPVTTGNPQQLAQSLSRLYEQATDRGRAGGRQALRIVADVPSNTVIVRADDDEFQQIKALAEALQQEAGEQGVSVRVLRLAAAPAARVAAAIREAFATKAQQTNQPLSIQIDAQGNALIIASTGALFAEIEQTAEQLDAMFPGGLGGGQSIFIIELENISPEEAKGVVETIGLHQPQPADSSQRIVTEPIRISVLRGRNAVIVVANPADQETIVGLLKAIDIEPLMAESTVRLVHLKNARAQALAQMLSQMLRPAEQQAETALARAIGEQVRRLNVRRDGAGEPDLQLDLSKPIRIIADPNMNALLVSSTASNVAAIAELAAMFDRLPITEAVTVQMFPLQNIAADQFTRIVRELFQQGKQLGRVPGAEVTGVPAGMAGKALLDDIAITTDERTNTVIVAGKEETVALVEVLTKRLDTDIATGWIEPRILPLRFADATDLAATLRAVLIEGQTNLPQSTPLQRQIGRLRMARQEHDGGRVLESDVFQPMTRLVIRPEPQLNALILVGTPINLELVSELVGMLDIEAASPSATVRIYPVEHASASRLAQTVTRLFNQQAEAKAIRPEDRVIVQHDERTNSLIVTTSARSFAVLESLLDSLDQELAPELREIRRIELRHASATRLAGLIQNMMDARLERLRRVQPETAELERATIIAEPRTNSLIIAAGKESFEVIQRLAADLDERTLADAAMIHVIPVEKGNIDRIAAATNQIMDRRYADQPQEIRRSQMPLVLTDPRTNSLLVAANPEDLQSIENLVARLAQAPISPAVGLHVVSVDPATSVEPLANRLQRLMQERAQSLGDARTSSDRVSVEPHPATNSLIVVANEENLEVIQGLIDMLVTAEAESPVGRDVDLFLLTKSRASEMVTLLEELHVREANRQRGESVIRVTADERLNAVLVNAPASDVEIIRNLVGRLDGTRPARVVETKFITLQAANAIETVNLIENVLSGRGIGSTRATEQATILRYIREMAKGTLGDVADEIAATEMEVGAAIRESITLTPDVRTNTVIVTAPRESMRLIELMVRDLDASSVGSQNIRIFKLTNADAIAMARVLTDLFSLQRQGNLFVLRPREVAEAGRDVMSVDLPDAPEPTGLGGIELTAVPDERQLLAITVDSRTNSLLVSGTPSYLDLVEQVITELDNQEATERESFVYPLRNAEALEVASVVTDFIEREQEKLVGTLGVDQVGSAARLLEREITIVGDEKSNRVLVSASPRYVETVKRMIEQLDVDPPQVLIQVMLAEVTLDDTFDWGVDFAFEARADGALISGGYGLADAFATGMGVPNIAIASSDFELLINAMKSQGRLQVLSNPSVMAANNEQARIQVGETLRLPTDVSVTETGRTLTSVEPEEIGVILNVRPSINPDGYVRMVINPEISNLSARTTRISEDFEAPIITRRTADTTVTVLDGQTIVLGGLISDRFERRDQKVPLLGDIPILGALFRAEREQSAKTELLIVLTPHVIQSPAEVHRIRSLTDEEIERLTVPKGFRDAIRRRNGRSEPH